MEVNLKKIFKYVTHLNSLPETTISKQAFLIYFISKDLFIKKRNSFYGKVMDIVKTLNCNQGWVDYQIFVVRFNYSYFKNM